MGKIKITLAATVGYDSLPIPDKLVIPIATEKFGVFSYKQHDSDPLTAEKIAIRPAGENRLTISLRLTGRIAVKNFPDARLGGSKVEITGRLAIHTLKLRLLDPQITRLDLSGAPAPLDHLMKHLLNKFLLKKLAEALQIDLQTPVEKAMAQINQPDVFELKIGQNNLLYEFNANVEALEPALAVFPEGLQFNFEVALAPAISLIRPLAAFRKPKARRRIKRRSRKTT
jgi:hypothetical protein